MQPTDTSAVVEALRAHDRFMVTSHDNPDGDALGSLLATHLALEALGKDTVMVLGGVAPLPGEYAFLELEERGLLRTAPPDAGRRVLVAVDCAQESRIVDPTLIGEAPLTVNIDHHHDNTRFGDVDLVVDDASSTAEVLADVFAGLGLALTPAIAEALYTAVVTDTGRFQYSNTTPKALRLAAELVEAGADVSRVFVEVYESTPFPKLKLLARALERATELAEGRVVVSELRREDFDAAGAEEPYSEGIIDHLRAVDGAELVALVRELPEGATTARKGSLRSHPDGVDVSAIARSFGGGGHMRAAGFSTDLTMDEITRRIVDAFRGANGDRPR
jgi:phosphoesterase RecJ-like protein